MIRPLAGRVQASLQSGSAKAGSGDEFNARWGTGQPFILAAHSQGAILTQRLLYEAITATPPRSQPVAAYLVEGRVTVDGLRERALDSLPAARLMMCTASSHRQ